MSSTDVTNAVERIRTDEPFAVSVLERGPSALSEFDLSDDEQRAIVDALRLDVEAGTDEVGGFSFGFGMPLTNLIGVGRSLGSSPAAPGQSGWIEQGWRSDGMNQGGGLL